ncbi:tetratricopeptide repeat protein [Paucibacter sp. R3-3]|uniref:Tetratricopeptide repeat protein n=1 Tax=Roseateles agri TaxID=3098619 RepID=A0ABU5DTG4_9BURK|nr:tetratricopeptide repeat protein [Paucibacter sp. R3-3]MDY0748739.1 tetratricopeptide repeat protein [Paucibacter sp. R3-3]
MYSDAQNKGLPFELIISHGRAVLELQRAERNVLNILLLLAALRGNQEGSMPKDVLDHLTRNPWTLGIWSALKSDDDLSRVARRLLDPIDLNEAVRLGRLRDWLLVDCLLEAEASQRRGGADESFEDLIGKLDRYADHYSMLAEHLSDRHQQLMRQAISSVEKADEIAMALYENFQRFKLSSEGILWDHPDEMGDRRPSMLAFAAMAERQDRIELAVTLYEEVARDGTHRTDESFAMALYRLGGIERGRGDFLRSRVHLENALAVFERINHEEGANYARIGLAETVSLVGEHLGALNWLAQVRDSVESDRLSNHARLESAKLLRRLQEPDAARALYEQILSKSQQANDLMSTAEAFLELGEIERERLEWNAALYFYRQARDAFVQLDAPLGIARASSGLALSFRQHGDSLEAEATYEESLLQFVRAGDRVGADLVLQELKSLRADAGASHTLSNQEAPVRQTVEQIGERDQTELLKRFPNWVSEQQATEMVQIRVRVRCGEDLDALSDFIFEARPDRIEVGLSEAADISGALPSLRAVALFRSNQVRTVGVVHLIDGGLRAEIELFDYWSLLDPDQAGDSSDRFIQMEAVIVGVGVEE